MSVPGGGRLEDTGQGDTADLTAIVVPPSRCHCVSPSQPEKDQNASEWNRIHFIVLPSNVSFESESRIRL